MSSKLFEHNVVIENSGLPEDWATSPTTIRDAMIATYADKVIHGYSRLHKVPYTELSVSRGFNLTTAPYRVSCINPYIDDEMTLTDFLLYAVHADSKMSLLEEVRYAFGTMDTPITYEQLSELLDQLSVVDSVYGVTPESKVLRAKVEGAYTQKGEYRCPVCRGLGYIVSFNQEIGRTTCTICNGEQYVHKAVYDMVKNEEDMILKRYEGKLDIEWIGNND